MLVRIMFYLGAYSSNQLPLGLSALGKLGQAVVSMAVLECMMGALGFVVDLTYELSASLLMYTQSTDLLNILFFIWQCMSEAPDCIPFLWRYIHAALAGSINDISSAGCQ